VKKIFLFIVAILTACAPQTIVAPTASSLSLSPQPRVTSTSTPIQKVGNGLWISPAVPDQLQAMAKGWGVPLASDSSSASITFDISSSAVNGPSSTWIYALVAPFPTVTDGVTLDDLKSAWHGSSSGHFDCAQCDPLAGRPLWMAESTLSAFTAIWGAPADGSVKVTSADQLLDNAWKNLPSWGIVPFESLDPKWKVLTVDGQSPIRKDFDLTKYPLQINFALQGNVPSTLNLPPSNRDALKLTTLIMTGTTSLVNGIAYQMEVKGMDYPARDIGDMLRQADILHVSNKTSFAPNCPPPNPSTRWPRCSDPKYIQLLVDVGVKVVELTGPHILDDGVGPFLYTLNLYKQNNMQTYGGGANLAEASQPLLIENHGNKIAFIGCNAGEPPQPLATDYSPGANPCDYKQLANEIGQVRAQGYLPIVTFQYKEGYSPQVMPWQSVDFRKAADAGAVIVSGSQAHAPLQMEFYKDTFIHYGLGNFFYDQMGNQPPDPTNPSIPPQPAQRWEFLDRHVFYDGKYIGTELLTEMLEDYSRPRPMTTDERASFLTAYFSYSGWIPLVPTPAPAQTPTLYPLLKFNPLPTYTPQPRVTPTP